MFDADRPIVSQTQDRLNRATFAKYLARSMLDHQDINSLVVGLYGGWGVGKTSILNMVREELELASTNILEDERPIILNFSAWSYSGQHQLIYSFFRRLSSTLRSVPNLENADRIIHLLELYVSFFTHKPVPRMLRTKRSMWDRLRFKGQEEVYAWESGRDLTLIKAELNALLMQQKQKIIIFIDNISRLYADEIKQMFQIVKSMGDYANTTYLLSFDKVQVVEALNRIDHEDGEAYVEKIVQLPFEVPPILQQDLEKILADRLNDVLIHVPEETWNSEYWADVYYSALRYVFKNCRDITRYVNTLHFSYPRLRDLVNPVDFFALSAIEVFLPAVYVGIRENKDLFTDLLDNVYALNLDQIEKERLRTEEILKRTTRISRETLLALLMRLFPRIHQLYYPESAFYYSDQIARKNRRIASPDLFDIYFRLSLQSAQIPQSEFETILTMASDREAFNQALTRLNQDERIVTFLDQLDSQVLQTFPKTNIQNVISALIDNGDLFPLGICGPLQLDTPMRIHRIIHALLRRFKLPEERFWLLQQAIANATKSLYIIVHELKEQRREHTDESDTFLPLEFRDLAPEQLDSLCQLAVSRIQLWATNGSLATHPRLLPILQAWLEWGEGQDCRTFVKNLTDTDRGLISFLRATLSLSILEAQTHYQKRSRSAEDQAFADIAIFIPPQELVDHAKTLFEDPYFEKLTEEEQLALMIFLDHMHVPTNKVITKTSG